MAALGSIIGVFGSIISAVGTIAAGQQAQAAANFQAKQLEQQGVQELAASQRESYEFKQNKERALSRQVAVAASSGLSASDPSVLYLAGETAARGRYQEEMAIYTGQERKQGLETQAKVTRMSGQAAAQGAGFSAAGTILGGFASFFDKYGQLGVGSSQPPSYVFGTYR